MVTVWNDPRQAIWGFHLHQELPLDEFRTALIIQKHCAEFLTLNDIPIDNDDAIKPGYGPHLQYMWELRVESSQANILEQLGLAISYFAINRHTLRGYIHPLMHDRNLSGIAALTAEGRLNQTNAIWFGARVEQHQDFFFNPPLDAQQHVVDTRTSRVMSQSEKELLCAQGIYESLDPYQHITNGFHIHMDYNSEEKNVALSIFDNFLIYLHSENLKPTSTRVYEPLENGPHVLGGWEVKFETPDPTIIKNIGIAIGWLICNRQGLSVFMHPVTWKEGDVARELKAHQEYSFFIGHMPELNLNFFKCN